MAVINGTPFDDYLVGTKFADFIQGYDGDDVLYGKGGNDQILGQNGNDYIDGGDGNDRLLGGDGYDVIQGGNGCDRIEGGDDADRLYGGTGNDTILGGDGKDLLNGYTGNDYLAGGSDCDTYTGFSRYSGHDIIDDNNLLTLGGDDVDLNYFLSDAVKFRQIDTDFNGNADALKIGLSSGADITVLHYFANTSILLPGNDSNIDFHFADDTFNYLDVVSHLGNTPV